MGEGQSATNDLVHNLRENDTMWRHAHEDEGAKAHSLAIVNVSTELSIKTEVKKAVLYE